MSENRPKTTRELIDDLEVFFGNDSIVKAEDQNGNLVSVKRVRPDADGKGNPIVVLETRKL